MRLTRPNPVPRVPEAAQQAEHEFQERLGWYRRQAPPREWPSGLVRLFVRTRVEAGQQYMMAVQAYDRRMAVLKQRAEAV